MGKRKARQVMMDKIKSNELKGVVLLIVAAIIWGLALVAQKTAMKDLGPFAFTAIRFLIGGVTLIPLILFLDRDNISSEKCSKKRLSTLFSGSLICALALGVLVIAQQVGVQYTTIGKTGFITALYIVIVPLAGIFLKRKVTTNVWIAVIIAMVGFYLMCMAEGFSQMNKGDIIMVIAALACTVHMYFIDHFVEKVDPVRLSSVQFLFLGLICGVISLFTEKTTWENVCAAAIPIIYTGFCSCGIGYTAQIVGQKYVEPAKASLLLSSETIFTMIAGMIFFGEVLSAREYLGCLLIFVAIIISQIKRKP